MYPKTDRLRYSLAYTHTFISEVNLLLISIPPLTLHVLFTIT